MSRAKALTKRMDEVNPFKLGRESVRSLTISTTADKLAHIKNNLDTMMSEFILEEDNPKTVAALKECTKLLNSAIANLRKVETQP